MKLCFGILCCLVSAVALHAQVSPPLCGVKATNPKEIEIVQAVCAGNRARGEMAAKRKAEKTARKAALAGSDEPDARFLLLRNWKAAEMDLRDAENRMYGNFNRAIEMTASYYGITPSKGEGPILDGPAVNGTAYWVPRYRYREDRSDYIVEEVTLPGGKAIHMRWKPEEDYEKRPGAMTFPNGRIDVYDEVMDKVVATGSARQLGFVLHHESVHFDQLRKGQWASLYLREVEAYRESRKAAARFGLTPDERRGVDDLFWQNVRRVASDGLRGGPRSGNVPTPEDEAFNSGEWDSLVKGVEQARKDRQELEANLRAEQEDRRMREAVAERERERLEDGRRLFASLENFSRRLCESAVSGVVPEEMYDEFLRWRNGNYLAFSREQPVVDLGELGFTAECPTFFENQILIARRKGYSHAVVTFDWAKEVLREAYRRSHPVIPSLPSVSPVQPSPPVTENPGSDPFPDAEFPRPPSVPHCRYHAWCQDKTTPQED